MARYRYRGAKMALWLELVPKIHRSDQLDRRFHLLDDHDNRTTFERDGTRQLILDEPFRVDDRHWTTTAAAATPSSASSTRHPPTSSVAARRTSTSRRAGTTPPRRSGGGEEPASRAGSLAVVELAGANAPLSVTVAVGCALLLLNVAVFVVVCRQKRRAQIKLGAAAASRGRSRDAGAGDTESACFDSNRSSVSSYSLAASVQHGPADYGRTAAAGGGCRNVRFCEARCPPAAAVTSQGASMTSQDGGGSFATRRLPARPGRENDVEGGLDDDTTATSNHLNNPSTTV